MLPGGSDSLPGSDVSMERPAMHIKRGDRIRIRPEWQDSGDDEFEWIAIEDEDGGRVRIAPILPEMNFPPNQVVTTNMVEWVAHAS